MNKSSTAQPAEENEGFSNRPTNTIRSGHGIKFDSWNQNGKNGPFETASLTRSYQDAQGEWHDQKITNLSADELLALSRDAGRMRDAMVDKAQDKGRTR